MPLAAFIDDKEAIGYPEETCTSVGVNRKSSATMRTLCSLDSHPDSAEIRTPTTRIHNGPGDCWGKRPLTSMRAVPWRLFNVSRYNAPTMSRSHRPRALSGLYVILDPAARPGRPLIDVLNAAARAGVTIFQYRNKTASMKEAFGEALPLRNRARELKVLFLVNDRCDLALAMDADGVHLGQNDLPVAQARNILGPQTVIGLSTHNDQQVAAADRLQPDYIGFGPIFAPGSKADHDPIVGIDALRRIRSLTRLPIFAIGGIQLGQVREVTKAGADGIAVISALASAPDIEVAVSALLEQMH